jgi:pimeloyl-ACP methyl ester carboxylesterase
MPRLRSNGIDLEYEITGDAAATPLLAIMGLGAQLIRWEDGFCRLLAERGLRVIRFDNRDVGLSSKLDAAGTPRIARLMAAGRRGEVAAAPYRVSDMADDSAGLLDGLGIDAAHVVGASMGGVIAQNLALRQPRRVISLTSLMSTTLGRDLPPPTPEASKLLATPYPAQREAFIEHELRNQRVLAGKGFAFEEERIRRRAACEYDRCFHPAGIARQLAAIVTSGSQRDALASLRVPTLVIHGDQDPLVPLEAGIDTAAAIPGARLQIIEGMGHELPRGAWSAIASAIAEHVGRASSPTRR